jgi:ATP-dependent DNA helicase DinG
MNQTLDTLLNQKLTNHVYWIAIGGSRGQLVSLRCSPIRVGSILREDLFGKVQPTILTSATLAVGGDEEFTFLRNRLGLEESRMAVLGSPYDYGTNVRLHLVRMPDPKDRRYIDALAERIPYYIEQSEGRALVLFTSYRTMRTVYERTREAIEGMGYRLMMQRPETSRSKLLEAFRTDISSVLFGTESFWQGVDVPGESLSSVIVTRLPFAAPDDPLREARMEEIEAGGGNAFMHYSLPEAVLRFKQGFGRLIRRGSDTGMVVVMDSRILTKRYGKVFLDSIPRCSLVYD